MVVKIEPGAIYYYYTDPAGTPFVMTDLSGNVVWKADYMPFGEDYQITSTHKNDKMFVGKEKDKETGFYYFGARYMRPEIGRFLSPDPGGAVDVKKTAKIGVDDKTGRIVVDPKTRNINVKNIENPQRLNLYAYGLNNPYRYIDPVGRDVTIVINRTTYTPNSIVSTITVNSTVANSTFSGYTLENRIPSNPNLPVPPGTYNASVRTDDTPNRVELTDVPNASNVQIHVANSALDLNGCFAVGTSTSEDWVGGSTNAMNSINNIISADHGRRGGSRNAGLCLRSHAQAHIQFEAGDIAVCPSSFQCGAGRGFQSGPAQILEEGLGAQPDSEDPESIKTIFVVNIRCFILRNTYFPALTLQFTSWYPNFTSGLNYSQLQHEKG